MADTELQQEMLGIGIRLLESRQPKGITKERPGEQAGTNQAVIVKIENGKSLQTRIFDGLALVLDVNPAWLQWGEPIADMRVE